MIKVLHLITGLEMGGAEMMLYKLLNYMDKSKFSNVVVTMMEPGPLYQYINELGINIYSLGMNRGMPSIRGMFHFLSILKEEQPDIVQTWLYHADLLGQLAHVLYPKYLLVWNLRCSDMRNVSWLTRIIVKTCSFLSKYPSLIIVNSESGKQYHQSFGYIPKRWAMIPNGFELNRFYPNKSAGRELKQQINVTEGSLLVGMIARYDPMKNYPCFIEAASIVLNRMAGIQDIHFVLVGSLIDTDNKELCEMIKQEGMSQYFHLLGQRNDIPDILNSLDICCLSSSYGEGFPNVIGEAMACEVPCVVTNVGDLAIVVGDTGIVVPPGNPHELANALIQMITMEDKERELLGQKAHQRVSSNFDIAFITKQYEDVYVKLQYQERLIGR